MTDEWDSQNEIWSINCWLILFLRHYQINTAVPRSSSMSNRSNLHLPPFFSSLFSSLYPLLNPGGWRHSAQHSRIHAFTQDDLFRTNCVHYTRRESEREREQTLFLSCEIKTLCMFAGPAGGHTHSQHTSLRLSAQRITFIKDSLKTTEVEDGQNSFLYLVLPCLVF